MSQTNWYSGREVATESLKGRWQTAALRGRVNLVKAVLACLWCVEGLYSPVRPSTFTSLTVYNLLGKDTVETAFSRVGLTMLVFGLKSWMDSQAQPEVQVVTYSSDNTIWEVNFSGTRVGFMKRENYPTSKKYFIKKIKIFSKLFVIFEVIIF